LKGYKSTGILIPAELFQEGVGHPTQRYVNYNLHMEQEVAKAMEGIN
jgi:hypothetical protein